MFIFLSGWISRGQLDHNLTPFITNSSSKVAYTTIRDSIPSQSQHLAQITFWISGISPFDQCIYWNGFRWPLKVMSLTEVSSVHLTSPLGTLQAYDHEGLALGLTTCQAGSTSGPIPVAATLTPGTFPLWPWLSPGANWKGGSFST